MPPMLSEGHATSNLHFFWNKTQMTSAISRQVLRGQLILSPTRKIGEYNLYSVTYRKKSVVVTVTMQ